MKKLIVWMLIAVTLLSMFGCAQKEPEDERVAAATKFIHAVVLGGAEELRGCVHPKLYTDVLERWDVGHWVDDDTTVEITATGEIRDEGPAKDLQDLREDISRMAGEYLPIEDVCGVVFTVSVRSIDRSEETRERVVIVGKVDGIWYALAMA